MMTSALADPVVVRAADGFRRLYGGRLSEIILFGSRARGEADEDSDYDILVVVEDLTPADQRRSDELCGDLLTDLDAIVTPFLLSRVRASELRARERRIMREIANDGISLISVGREAS